MLVLMVAALYTLGSRCGGKASNAVGFAADTADAQAYDRGGMCCSRYILLSSLYFLGKQALDEKVQRALPFCFTGYHLGFAMHHDALVCC